MILRNTVTLEFKKNDNCVQEIFSLSFLSLDHYQCKLGLYLKKSLEGFPSNALPVKDHFTKEFISGINLRVDFGINSNMVNM